MNARNAVLLHGKPKRERYFDSNQPKPHEANWFPYARDELAAQGYGVVIPELPTPYDPNYADCEEVLDGLPIHEKTLLVGHSLGAGLILRYMSEQRELVVAKAILVAPWLDPDGKYGDLFKFKIDRDIGERCKSGLIIYYSSDDDRQAQDSLEKICSSVLDARYRNIPEYGHFMLGNTMESTEFPELLEEI